jgi:hypothetical protein
MFINDERNKAQPQRNAIAAQSQPYHIIIVVQSLALLHITAQSLVLLRITLGRIAIIAQSLCNRCAIVY